MRSPRPLTTLIVLVTVALPLAACSDDDTAEKATESDRTVTVTMTDNAFTPKDLSVTSGESVTFEFVNDGQLTHEAYIGSEEEQEDHATKMSDDEMSDDDGHHSMNTDAAGVVTVEPGDHATLTRTFDETGTVIIGCHQPGHWEAGMKATIDVG